MKINIVVSEESSQAVQEADVVEAVRSHFNYQAEMTRALIRKRFTVGRFFLLIGLAVLFTCLGVAQFFELQLGRSQVGAIFQEGLVIVGWVAMWRPVELMLYDWWPLREEMQYYQKIAALPVEIRSAHL